MWVIAGTPQSPSASAYVESYGRMPHGNLPRVSVIRCTLTETCRAFQTAHGHIYLVWCAVSCCLCVGSCCRLIVMLVTCGVYCVCTCVCTC